MRLPARPGARVPGMPMRIIDHLQALGRERFRQFPGNAVTHLHAIRCTGRHVLRSMLPNGRNRTIVFVKA
jgi:hypothetical protein